MLCQSAARTANAVQTRSRHSNGTARHNRSRSNLFVCLFVCVSFVSSQGVCIRCGKKGHSREHCTARVYECSSVCTNCGAIGIHDTPKCPHPPLPPATLVLNSSRREWVIPPNGRVKIGLRYNRDYAVNVGVLCETTFNAVLYILKAILLQSIGTTRPVVQGKPGKRSKRSKRSKRTHPPGASGIQRRSSLSPLSIQCRQRTTEPEFGVCGGWLRVVIWGCRGVFSSAARFATCDPLEQSRGSRGSGS